MNRGCGWVPNPKGHMRTRFGASMHTAAAERLAATPVSVDLRPHAPAVMDQGNTGSCTGHGTAMGLATAFAVAGTPLPFVPSPDGIYRNGRAIDRVRHLNGSFPVLTDDGAMPNQVIRAVNAFGVRAMRAPTRDADGAVRNSDANPATINDEPSPLDIETEQAVIPVGDHAITSVEQGAKLSDVVLNMRKALAAGMPVGLGLFVDTAFENWTPAHGPMGACNQNDPNGGGHWLVCLGYRTAADGNTIFTIRNSWSTGWGDHGDVEVTDAFLAQCTDLTAYVAQKAA